MINRRVFIAATGAVASTWPNSVHAAKAPGASVSSSHIDIARRVRVLAEEMSHLLGVLDDGMWEVRASAPYRGAPIYSVQPQRKSPELRLEEGLRISVGALTNLRPGTWRKEVCLSGGFALLIHSTS